MAHENMSNDPDDLERIIKMLRKRLNEKGRQLDTLLHELELVQAKYERLTGRAC